MIRTYEYSEWVFARRGSVRAVARMMSEPRRRGRRRTAEELEMLERSALAAIRNRERSGRLERLGPREFLLKG